MTWSQLVLKRIPETRREPSLRTHILWEHTCFPMGDRDEVDAQLIKLAGKVRRRGLYPALKRDAEAYDRYLGMCSSRETKDDIQ